MALNPYDGLLPAKSSHSASDSLQSADDVQLTLEFIATQLSNG